MYKVSVCLNCGGTGYFIIKDSTPNALSWYIRIECVKCKGTGLIKEVIV